MIKKCRGAKNPETAAKVALMKLKMHACGEKSVPQVNHVYGIDKYISEKLQSLFLLTLFF